MTDKIKKNKIETNLIFCLCRNDRETCSYDLCTNKQSIKNKRFYRDITRVIDINNITPEQHFKSWSDGLKLEKILLNNNK